MNNSVYCVAEFQDYQTFNTPNGDEQRLVDQTTQLESFSAVLAYLRNIYDKHATEFADANAESSPHEVPTPIGGFCSILKNRYDGVAIFALGREYCLFIIEKPAPGTQYAQGGENDDVLDFWHVGWHHTEYSICELALRDDCLIKLEEWLDSNMTPTNGG